MEPEIRIVLFLVWVVMTFLSTATILKDARSLRERGVQIKPALWATLICVSMMAGLPFYLLLRVTVWKRELRLAEEERQRIAALASTTVANEANAQWPCTDVVAAQPNVEVIAPTVAKLRHDGVGQTVADRNVVAALTSSAIWIQDTWRTERIPLRDLQTQPHQPGNELALSGAAVSEPLWLKFDQAHEADNWQKQILLLQSTPLTDTSDHPEGVTLVRNMPNVAHEDLGPIDFIAPTEWAARRGVQLRAAMRGADAVVDMDPTMCADLNWQGRVVAGRAVRIPDADGRLRLRLRWYSEEMKALFRRMFVLLLVYLMALLVVWSLLPNVIGLDRSTAQLFGERLVENAVPIGIPFVFPLFVLGLMRVVRWPQLVRVAGIVILAAVSLRELAVLAGHFIAVQMTGAEISKSMLWTWLDPFSWAFIFVGVGLCARAWRLAADAAQILPAEYQFMSFARAFWSRSLLIASCIYSVALIGLCGWVRYQESAYVLQPGVDVGREGKASALLHQGIDLKDGVHANPVQAERLLTQSLAKWEELTAPTKAPVKYRVQLVCTLCNLGVVRAQQNRLEEAAQCYARAVEIADGLTASPACLDDNDKRILKSAHENMAAHKRFVFEKEIKVKLQLAGQKYEDGQIRFDKEPAIAEKSLREAIKLWEETPQQAIDVDHLQNVKSCLYSSYCYLAEIEAQTGRIADAESSLQRAIKLAEQLVQMDPGRELNRHRLATSRKALDELRDRTAYRQLVELTNKDRFADAWELIQKTIQEREVQLRTSPDAAEAKRRLAFQLDCSARFLAHCPDDRIRNGKRAIEYARSATTLQPDDGDFWYTLALVQYRHKDWHDSMATLQTIKNKSGNWVASEWFLQSMNLHHLNRHDESKAAYRSGANWIVDQKRQAEKDPAFRLQFELVRPSLEAMQHEAEALINGKGPGQVGVG